MSRYIILTSFVFLLSATCGFILIPQILSFCKRKNLYDTPNSRKIHKNAVPRLGGISFMPSMIISTIIGLMVWASSNYKGKIEVSPWSIFFGVGISIIYITGLLDDIFGIRAKKKLLMQLIVASLLPISFLYINNLYGFFGIYEIPSSIGIPLTIFVIVFIMNAINLIDGIDGLSASLSLLALIGFFYIFLNEKLYVYCVLIAGLMGVLIPFLYHNILGNAAKGKKIFMGDSGSLTIGYILGVLLIKFCMYNPHIRPYQENSILLSLTLLLVPILDVCRVILVRILHNHPIFKADKNHIHHKLLRAGLNQHQALIVIISLAIGITIINIALNCVLTTTYILPIDIIIYMLFHLVLNHLITKKGSQAFVEGE